MKRFLSRYKLALALAALMLTGCATPQLMPFNVDVLQPNTFTLDVEETPAAFVATYSDDKLDSAEVATVALAAARKVEEANALEEGEVGAFTIPASEFKGTSDKEYLEQLMMATGSGLLAIISDIDFGQGTVSRTYNSFLGAGAVAVIPTKAHLTIYDAIADTTLFQSAITDSIKFRIPDEYAYSTQSVQEYVDKCDSLIFAAFGNRLASKVCENWIEEEWMLIDYPQESAWHTAYKHAMDFKWEDAIKEWMPMTEDQNSEKASFAAFNIAVACQMLGNTDLAENWITYARSRYDFEQAGQLHKYLKMKKNKSQN